MTCYWSMVPRIQTTLHIRLVCVWFKLDIRKEAVCMLCVYVHCEGLLPCHTVNIAAVNDVIYLNSASVHSNIWVPPCFIYTLHSVVQYINVSLYNVYILPLWSRWQPNCAGKKQHLHTCTYIHSHAYSCDKLASAGPQGPVVTSIHMFVMYKICSSKSTNHTVKWWQEAYETCNRYL